MEFTLKITLGNGTMRTASDVRDAITRSLATSLASYPLPLGEQRYIHDENGNTVGAWRVTRAADDPEPPEPDTGRCPVCGEWLDSRGHCGNACPDIDPAQL